MPSTVLSALPNPLFISTIYRDRLSVKSAPALHPDCETNSLKQLSLELCSADLYIAYMPYYYTYLLYFFFLQTGSRLHLHQLRVQFLHALCMRREHVVLFGRQSQVWLYGPSGRS